MKSPILLQCHNKHFILVMLHTYFICMKVRIQCGENVSFMKADPHHRTHVAVGGKENAVKLYDLERHDAGPVFQAKNVC